MKNQDIQDLQAVVNQEAAFAAGKMTVDWTAFRFCLTQTQAAALAVLASDIRQGMKKLDRELDSQETAVYRFWSGLETNALKALECRDGEVVQHLGRAAKQMNPLLAN